MTDYTKQLVEQRRELHQWPEEGWTEFWTTNYIVNKLRSWGYEVLLGTKIINPEQVFGRNEKLVQEGIKNALARGVSQSFIDETEGYTGCVALLDTGKEGPTTAFRFDIDCVCVNETDNSEHKPNKEGFRSQHAGFMHACGHDSHISIGLTLAHWIAERKDELKGKFKIVFQPAEEGVRGARPMTETGIFDDVDFFFGNHLGFNLPTGTISPEPGVFLASTKLDATFTGLAAHSGADPQKGKNALLAGAAAALAIHGITRPIGEVTALNVGTLVAGQGRNVVAPNAFMQLEVRGETEELNAYMCDQAIRKIKASADMYDCQVDIVKAGEATEFKPDQEAIDLAYIAARNVTTEELAKPLGLKLGSEDCTIMLRRVQQHGGKGTFVVFGCRTSAGHHQRLFDFDEDVIGIALRFYQNLIPMIVGIK